jgi:integrase/recombinase XerD
MNTDLSLLLESYLSVRAAQGFKTGAQRTLLRDFIQFVHTQGDGGPIRAQLALDWACASSVRRGSNGAASRLTVARGFLNFLRATLPDTEVPDYHLLAAPRRPKPYLFTPAQIAAVIRAARDAKPQTGLRPDTLATAIGLLASTGLRAGEVMRLTVADVKLEGALPHLYILQTKFGKSRLVPLHATTADQLRHYAAQRTAWHYAGLSEVFFMGERGQPLNHDSLGRWFSRLCRKLGFWPSDERRQPTLGSLRHSFAVQRLRTWYEAGEDVQALLPNLAIYLGHIRPEETFWYLSALPELLGAAAERFEAYALGRDIS